MQHRFFYIDIEDDLYLHLGKNDTSRGSYTNWNDPLAQQTLSLLIWNSCQREELSSGPGLVSASGLVNLANCPRSSLEKREEKGRVKSAVYKYFQKRWHIYSTLNLVWHLPNWLKKIFFGLQKCSVQSKKCLISGSTKANYSLFDI